MQNEMTPEYLSSLAPPTNLSETENKTIFSAVQEFILKTKRF